MDICLISFGQAIKNIREDLSLTQKDVFLKSGVGSETLRRIESGKVIPKFETLEFLSTVYKQDLNSMFLKYRMEDHSNFYEIKNNLESKFDRDDFKTLNVELKKLSSTLESINNSFYKNLIQQLMLLTEAVILYKDNCDNHAALDKLVIAMKITTPSFNLDEYQSFVYSSIEIRTLMNIAFILRRLKDTEKHLEIMEFCTHSIDFNDEIYPKLCHNLSTAYKRNNDFEKALEYSNLGIKSCQENRNFSGLNILYFGKGIAEYKLNKIEYKNSLNISIILCTTFGQDELRDKIIKNCREGFHINLEESMDMKFFY